MRAKSEIPTGWPSVLLGEVVCVSSEKVEPGTVPRARYVGLEHIESGLNCLVGHGVAAEVRSAKSVFQAGDVLYGRLRPYLNKVLLAEFEGICSTDILVLRCTSDIIPAFLERLLRTPAFLNWAITNSAGINLPRVSFEKLAGFSFLLPPLEEQRRIVSRLDKLMERSRRARTELAEVPAQLAQARQSLLASAFRGDLTASWRTKRKADAPLVVSDGAASLPLPTGWAATKLHNLVPKGGLFDGPFGSHLKSDDYTDSGVRVVRLENIGHLSFDDEKRTYVSQEKHRQLHRHSVCSGDLMFASFIFEPIRVCILPSLETKAIAKADCFCIRPDADLIDKRFLCYQLASPRIGHALAAHVHGATRPRVNTTQLRETSIAWCPLEEQREIVRRLDSALSRLDKVAAAQAAAIAELDRLDQALLARAFSGRLVPQFASAPSRSTRPVLKPKSYLTQLVPALLRAHGASLTLDQINTAVAFLHSPRTVRQRITADLGASEAGDHFADWHQAHEDGALTDAINTLLKTGTLTQTPPRKGPVTLHLVGKLPPIVPEVEADARHLASIVQHIPAEAVTAEAPRPQPGRRRQTVLTTA